MAQEAMMRALRGTRGQTLRRASAGALLLAICAILAASAWAEVQPTTDWCDVYSDDTLVNGQRIPVGAIVDAYDPQGVHCGSVAVHTAGQWGMMHVYGDDPLTAGVDEGADPGDTLTFTVDGQPAEVVAGDATWASKALREVALRVGAEPTRFSAPTWWSTLRAYTGPSWDAKPRWLSDVNGDGRADAVLFHPTKGVKVALSDGSAFGAPRWWTRLSAFGKPSWNAHPRYIADVNGDGLGDAVLFHKSKGIKVGISTGTSFRAPTWWSRHALFLQPSQDGAPRFLADVNGDGRADAVLFHPTLGVYVALSDGARFGAPQRWSTEEPFRQASQAADPRLVADANGDGLADIVVLQQAEGVRVALSTGSAFGPSARWSDEAAYQRSSQDTYPRALADVNGDGRADLALFHPTIGVKVSLSTGASFGGGTWWSREPAFRKASWDRYPRLLADVNGDGAADAALLHPTKGIKVALAEE